MKKNIYEFNNYLNSTINIFYFFIIKLIINKFNKKLIKSK